MKATTKGILGASIGGAIGLIGGIGFASTEGMSAGLIMGLFFTLIGIIGGFGLAFGIKLGIKWLGKVMGVTGAVSLGAILFSKDRRNGFLISFLLFTLVFSFTIGISYIPGIFIGIRQIKEERSISWININIYSEYFMFNKVLTI